MAIILKFRKRDVKLIEPFQHTSRKKESTDTRTEERKLQAAQLGIEPRASRFAHE